MTFPTFCKVNTFYSIHIPIVKKNNLYEIFNVRRYSLIEEIEQGRKEWMNLYEDP
jgi:hypothetical protein